MLANRRATSTAAGHADGMALHSVVDDPDNRFACAVAKYGDCDILTSWAQGDLIGRLDLERMMGHPRAARAEYAAGSPVHRIVELEVPILIDGELDDRVNLRQSQETHRGPSTRRQAVRVRHLPNRGSWPAANGTVPALPPSA